jgi:hypothetical protein
MQSVVLRIQSLVHHISPTYRCQSFPAPACHTRVTDLMISTHAETFCLVQYAWSRKFIDDFHSHTAWHRTRVHLSPLIPPPPMSPACRLPPEDYQLLVSGDALVCYDEVTRSNMIIVVYCKRVLFWNHPRSEMVFLSSELYRATWYSGTRTGPAVYRHAPAHENI